MDQAHRVVIVGGGFAGLKVAQALKRAAVQITLLDRRNYFLFQPLLYQVATGGLSPANIAAPLRSIFKRHHNVEVLLEEVTGFDVAGRRVLCRDRAFSYDTLVVATGVSHQYFGHDEWERWAPGLKTVEDATAIRGRLLSAFEAAEREDDPDKRKRWMTFVIVGGGPTGVELAGAVGELAHYTLRGDFRRITTSESRVILVETADRILSTYPAVLSASAERALTRLGVTVRTRCLVTDVREAGVTVRCGDATETIAARTILWAAGVQASALGQALAAAAGVELDRAGRARVEPDLSVRGHPEIFVIGDLAHVEGSSGRPLPGVAQVALQEGTYVARVIRARLRGQTVPPFEYRDRGSMATIGRNHAVADLGWLRLSGFLGWLIWLFIHLLYIEQFYNRLLILIQWAWSYFTRNRSARLITGETAPPTSRSP